MTEPQEKRPLLVPGTVAFAVVGAIVVAAALSTLNLWGSSGSSADPLVKDPQVLRPGDLRLSESPTDRTEFVAFLDFECERCAALYPYLDQLQRKYAGEVTFAIRHFPEAGHASAVDAALAVEAAARQGKLAEMAWMLYETQSEWGEAMDSQREVFAGFARQLGLDMKRYRADVDDPRLRARVAFDRREGMALGLGSAPGLFLDGRSYMLPESFVDMQEEINTVLES
ncbi:MAG: thioredoxin domain-containing protein [Solirubrobacterales bacterium]